MAARGFKGQTPRWRKALSRGSGSGRCGDCRSCGCAHHFVADAIPAELRRIVEFPTGQTGPAGVLALEVRQYRGGELRALGPRLVGKTVAAEVKKTVRGPLLSQRWFCRME